MKILCNPEEFSKLINACYDSTNCHNCVLSCICTENPKDLVDMCITKKYEWEQFLKHYKEKGSINEYIINRVFN